MFQKYYLKTKKLDFKCFQAKYTLKIDICFHLEKQPLLHQKFYSYDNLQK